MHLGNGIGSLGVQFGVPSSISGRLPGFSFSGVWLPPSAPVAHLASPVTPVLPAVSSFVLLLPSFANPVISLTSRLFICSSWLLSASSSFFLGSSCRLLPSCRPFDLSYFFFTVFCHLFFITCHLLLPFFFRHLLLSVFRLFLSSPVLRRLSSLGLCRQSSPVLPLLSPLSCSCSLSGSPYLLSWSSCFFFCSSCYLFVICDLCFWRFSCS